MGSIRLNLSRHRINPAYYPYLFDYIKRYSIFYGGAGSGKSHFAFQKIIVKALNDKRKVLVVRKVARTLKDSCFQMVIDVLAKFKILSLCQVNKSNYTIVLPNGSTFLFFGLDDVEKLKSITNITDIVIEEATEISLDDFLQLDLRLRANVPNLQIYLMFNPTSKASWVYKKWFTPDAVIDEDTQILQTTYKDNNFLPQAYIDAIEKLQKTNYAYYKIYALGEFASLDKLVFTNWKKEEFNHQDINGTLLIGMDFGFVNDASTLVASILDEETKTIYVFDEWGSTNKTNDELANIIKAKGYSKSLIIADSAEQKSIEEIRRLGIQRIRPSVKGADSVLHGIQRLQQYSMVVHPSLEGLITELENYSWQKDKQTGEYINKPLDEYNHYIDALRYSLQCANNNKVKFFKSL